MVERRSLRGWRDFKGGGSRKMLEQEEAVGSVSREEEGK